MLASTKDTLPPSLMPPVSLSSLKPTETGARDSGVCGDVAAGRMMSSYQWSDKLERPDGPGLMPAPCLCFVFGVWHRCTKCTKKIPTSTRQWPTGGGPTDALQTVQGRAGTRWFAGELPADVWAISSSRESESETRLIKRPMCSFQLLII